MRSADAAYRRRYVDGLAALWGVPAARLGVTGSSVAPVAARRGQRLVSLYRYGATNAGSGRLCSAVGFEMVAELEAFEWPAPGGTDG